MVAMQMDSNSAGEISREWVIYFMDLAAVVAADARAKGRVATAAVSNLNFLRPVKAGDVVCFYTAVMKTGRTSITVAVEVHALCCCRKPTGRPRSENRMVT
jgi:acyl-CoA thioesterase YciA